MRKFDQINVIPFIDIMLVLLAIVLTTATFIAQGKLEVDLPEASHSAPHKDEPAIEIAIDHQQQIYFDEQPLALTDLDSRLGALDKEQALTLRVDATVPFARFVEVVDLLKKHDLSRLSILTRKPA